MDQISIPLDQVQTKKRSADELEEAQHESPSAPKKAAKQAKPDPELIKLRNALKTKVVSALKKGPYKGNNLPVIEVVMGISDRDFAELMISTFLPGLEVASRTKTMTKYQEVGHGAMVALLNLPDNIQTNYKGKVWCLKGSNPSPIKTTIGFDRAEIHIKSNEIKIKGRGICEHNR